MNGFEKASTETLTVIRDNLRLGLTAVAEAIADGSFETPGVKGAAPPSQSGQTTLMLLAGIEAELTERTTMHNLEVDDRVYHRGEDRYGTFKGTDDTPDQDAVWVRFDGAADDEKVSREALSKVTS